MGTASSGFKNRYEELCLLANVLIYLPTQFLM